VESKETMDFPPMVVENVSDPDGLTLIYQKPAVAIPYIFVLGVIAVIGTFGNFMIIGTLTCGRGGCRGGGGGGGSGGSRGGAGYPVGNLFITNLAFSDFIVTAVINPFAIIGKFSLKVSRDIVY